MGGRDETMRREVEITEKIDDCLMCHYWVKASSEGPFRREFDICRKANKLLPERELVRMEGDHLYLGFHGVIHIPDWCPYLKEEQR